MNIKTKKSRRKINRKITPSPDRLSSQSKNHLPQPRVLFSRGNTLMPMFTPTEEELICSFDYIPAEQDNEIIQQNNVVSVSIHDIKN